MLNIESSYKHRWKKILVLRFAFFTWHMVNFQEMSSNVRKSTFEHLRPAKIQLNLLICAAWLDSQGCKMSSCGQHRLCSGFATLHRLILAFVGRTCQKVRILTLRLKWGEMQKLVFEHMRTAKAKRNLRSRAVWSGPSPPITWSLDFTKRVNGEQMPGRDFLHTRNETKSVHFAYTRRYAVGKHVFGLKRTAKA